MITDFSKISNSCNDCKDIGCAAAILQPAMLDQVSKNSRETSFRKGDMLIQAGSMTSNIIYLKSGLVKEYVTNYDQREKILQIVKQHTYLGLSSLFGDRVNHYSYSALTDVKVCYIDVAFFNRLVRENGNFAYEILVMVSRDSLNNFHRFMNHTEKKVYGRVAEALLYFSGMIFERDSFELPFTRQEFADLIGVSRESATRVLLKFQGEGLLSMQGRNIKVENQVMLEKISKNG